MGYIFWGLNFQLLRPCGILLPFVTRYSYFYRTAPWQTAQVVSLDPNGSPRLYPLPISTIAARLRVSAYCQKIQRGLPQQTLQMLGPTGVHDLCSHPSTEQPARYRPRTQLTLCKDLPHRHPAVSQIHSRRCRRTSRLSNL